MEEENKNEVTDSNTAPEEDTATESCDEMCCGQAPRPLTFEEYGDFLREEILRVADNVKAYSEQAKVEGNALAPHRGEMIANSILAYRHLEDARMRIGKVLQAYQGGKSILDKMSTEERTDISSRP